MSTIMVIPGAAAQIPLIKRIKELGHKVVCVNPYKNSPAFEFADYTEMYDILNVEACISVAKKYNVEAIVSDECDIAMPTVAAVADSLGLKALSPEMARLYTNKYEMRRFNDANSFDNALFKLCSSLEEATDFFETLQKKKMIIKPLDSNSSRGVFTITEKEQLDRLFSESMKYSHSEKKVICEEYIEGTEFTIDGIVIGGKHYSVAISEKKHYEHNPNVACELYFSHENDRFDYGRLREINNKYVEETGLKFGFTHAEYKFDGERFVLIEIGARGGGSYISSDIVPVMTNLDNYKILIDQILENDECREFSLSEDVRKRCCVLKFFDIPIEDNGKKLKEIIGTDILENDSRVIRYHFICEAGDTIFKAEDDSKRIGFYIAYGDTKEELDALISRIEKSVRFITEQ